MLHIQVPQVMLPLLMLARCAAAAALAGLPAVEPAPVVLFQFSNASVVDQWHVFTDAFFGGKSHARLAYNAEQQVRGAELRPSARKRAACRWTACVAGAPKRSLAR